MDHFVSTSQMLAMINAALGFQVHQSLVLIPFDAAGLLCLMRADLDDARDVRGIVKLAEVAASGGADTVIAVFISEASVDCPDCAQQFSAISHTLAAELAGRGAMLRDALVVDRIAEGYPWRSLIDGDETGLVADPRASVAAADAAVAGRITYASRGAALQDLAVDPHLAAAVAEYRDEHAVGVDLVDSVHLAVRLAERVAEGETPGAAELAEMGRALQVAEVVEVLFTLVDSRLARPAEALWTMLARCLPLPERAEALVLAGAARYLRGDGGLAQIAFETALRELPDHQMARLLQAALNKAIHPFKIRELFDGVPSALTV